VSLPRESFIRFGLEQLCPVTSLSRGLARWRGGR